MPKTPKRLTKRQLKELNGKGPSGTPKASQERHIHCISCGRHLDPADFSGVTAKAQMLTCQHGSEFAACLACVPDAQARLDEHDRTGNPPNIAAIWH
jgi:hypothetical protein